MKISPVSHAGPSGSIDTGGSSVSPDSRARAIAAATGQEIPQGSGDVQADRTQQSIHKIKMKTQASVFRDGPPAPIEESVSIESPSAEVPVADTNEPAQSLEETKPLSPQFAALAKAKRALQIERAQFEQQKAEAGKNSAIDPNEYISKADLQSNPLKIFESGLTYDQLTEAILNNQQAPITTKDIDALVEKKLTERLEKEFGSRDTQAEQQVLADLKREAIALTADGDQYEAIRQAGAQDDVVKLIHRIWQKGWADRGLQPGHIMDVSEAAELIENQLIDEALPFASLKKVQSRLTPQQEAIVQQAPVAPKPGTKIMRTLTNRDTANPQLDRRARAIAAMQGTLKRG